MREYPILMAGPLVRATLRGNKTVTRRLVTLGKPGTFGPSATPGYDWTFRGTRRGGTKGAGCGCWQDLTTEQVLALCPYGAPGDALYVRETWKCAWDPGHGHGVIYRADGAFRCFNGCCNGGEPAPGYEWLTANYGGDHRIEPWRPSIHMYRWAARLTLEVVSVRVERLRDISSGDVLREGFGQDSPCPPGVDTRTVYALRYPRLCFKHAWEEMHGAGSWYANPLVWVVEFRRGEG